MLLLPCCSAARLQPARCIHERTFVSPTVVTRCRHRLSCNELHGGVDRGRGPRPGHKARLFNLRLHAARLCQRRERPARRGRRSALSGEGGQTRAVASSAAPPASHVSPSPVLFRDTAGNREPHPGVPSPAPPLPLLPPPSAAAARAASQRRCLAARLVATMPLSLLAPSGCERRQRWAACQRVPSSATGRRQAAIGSAAALVSMAMRTKLRAIAAAGKSTGAAAGT